MTNRKLTLKSCAVRGPSGKSAYQAAVEGGFAGTEAEFYGRLSGLAWVTPEMYGAVGNGTTDDTAAFQAALDSGYPVTAKATYAVSEITVKNTNLLITGKIIGTVRLANNATVEGGTIQQTTTDPCVVIESRTTGNGYLNSTLRNINLKPKYDGGIGLKIVADDVQLFGYYVENVDITSCETSIWLYNNKWMTKGDIRNVFCHTPTKYVILAQNTKEMHPECLADITFSNVYAQFLTDIPKNFLRVKDGPCRLTLYDSLCYDFDSKTDGDESTNRYVFIVPAGSDANNYIYQYTRIRLYGQFAGNPLTKGFCNQESRKNFYFDNSFSEQPHYIKASAKVELPIDNQGSLAPEAFTGGATTRFVGLMARAGSNFGGTWSNRVSGLSWYDGRLSLMRSTDGSVANGTYYEVATPYSGAVYTTATLPSSVRNGAKVWCSDIKMDVTYYEGSWYKPDGTALE